MKLQEDWESEAYLEMIVGEEDDGDGLGSLGSLGMSLGTLVELDLGEAERGLDSREEKR